MKIICLDYDGTYNKFSELMNIIIDYCEKKNIKCILATMRFDYEKDDGLMELEKKIKIYYTGRKAKSEYLKCCGIIPDIWIDDNPIWIYKDSI